MTTIIIDQESGEQFTVITPLFDPEKVTSDAKNNSSDEIVIDEEETVVPANVYETEFEYELELLAPGLNHSDIEIEVTDDILTVSADRLEEAPRSNDSIRRREFIHKGFSRSFQLPEDALSDEIIADYKNGVVYLSIPKRDEDDTDESL